MASFNALSIYSHERCDERHDATCCSVRYPYGGSKRLPWVTVRRVQRYRQVSREVLETEGMLSDGARV